MGEVRKTVCNRDCPDACAIVAHVEDGRVVRLAGDPSHPVTDKRGDICSGAGDAAQLLDFGEEDSHDIFDLLNSKNILLWGKNVVVSSPHTVPVLKESPARKMLIDPVWHKTAHLCDAFVQP